jgi:hypothetical protein
MDAHEWTPWGPRPLREREGKAAQSELGGSFCAFDIPFLPFQITSFAGRAGLVAHSDGHRVGERKASCPNQDGTDAYQDRANP